MSDSNTGHYNTGHYNTGDRNTGYRNTGDCNTGDYNTGDCNTGDCNTGDYNTGDCNTGDCNTGDCNTGHYNTGDCNTNTPKVRLFNKESAWDFSSASLAKFRTKVYKYQKPLCEWVSEINMSKEEKEKYSTYKNTGGYLKTNKSMRNDLSITKEDEAFFRSVPNFDEKIFLTCTGIDLSNPKVKIIIDGKEIWISKESANALKAQL